MIHISNVGEVPGYYLPNPVDLSKRKPYTEIWADATNHEFYKFRRFIIISFRFNDPVAASYNKEQWVETQFLVSKEFKGLKLFNEFNYSQLQAILNGCR